MKKESLFCYGLKPVARGIQIFAFSEAVAAAERIGKMIERRQPRRRGSKVPTEENRQRPITETPALRGARGRGLGRKSNRPAGRKFPILARLLSRLVFRKHSRTKEVFSVPDELQPGEEVKIVTGPFQGLLAVVLRPQSGRARVAVLLEFQGRQTCIEVPNANVIRQANPRSF